MTNIMKSLFAAACISIVVLSFAGCKGKEKTRLYSTKEGKVEVKESGGEMQEMKITTKEETATFRTGEISEDIKPFVYPRASRKEGGAWSIQTNKEKAGGISSTYLSTKDDIDRVIAYYKESLKDKKPEYAEMTTPNGKMASFTVKEPDRGGVTIVLNEIPQGKGTEIHITKVTR